MFTPRKVHLTTVVLIVWFVSASPPARAADIGTAFGYQGFLEKPAGTPVNDTCDFRFGLFDVPAGGSAQGNSPQTVLGVSVVAGVFTSTIDFGPTALDGTARWLAIEVQCPGDGAFVPLAPRVELTPAPHALALPGLYTQQNLTSPNVIAGLHENSVSANVVGATISGGGKTNPDHNRVTDFFGTIGGGHSNQAGDGDLSVGNQPGATVGGGRYNTASSADSTIGGGISNNASQDASTVAGGTANSASGFVSTVGGGDRNTSSGPYSTIAGGFFNTANMGYSTVGGGNGNTAGGIYTTVAGGLVNTANGDYSTVAGGHSNAATGDSSIAGGGELNTASGNYSTVGGGRSNAASAAYATIAGGGPSDPSSPATILATRNLVTDEYGTIGGGANNQAGDNAGTTSDKIFATVGGGILNTASGGYSTVGGGVGNTASAERCTIGGGDQNLASGLYSTVGGGVNNTASGLRSTVPGGSSNQSGGDYSFAAGRSARVRDLVQVGGGDTDGDEGTFVWADSTNADFTSDGANRFLVRASGGTTIYSNAALTAGVSLAAGGGSWASISDRNVKRNVETVDSRAVLDRLAAVPIATWNYESQDPAIRHIGPMAQDFHGAFSVGEDERYITAIDADGIALAAIQGLYDIVKEKDCQIDELGSEISNLQSEIAELKELVKALAARDQYRDSHGAVRNGGGR